MVFIVMMFRCGGDQPVWSTPGSWLADLMGAARPPPHHTLKVLASTILLYLVLVDIFLSEMIKNDSHYDSALDLANIHFLHLNLIIYHFLWVMSY